MGQKLPLCAQLGATRSRQDESKEVGEVGSKRASLRCNAVHHVCWGGLISRLLLRPPAPAVGQRPQPPLGVIAHDSAQNSTAPRILSRSLSLTMKPFVRLLSLAVFLFCVYATMAGYRITPVLVFWT
jgi:hypothetical protein